MEGGEVKVEPPSVLDQVLWLNFSLNFSDAITASTEA